MSLGIPKLGYSFFFFFFFFYSFFFYLLFFGLYTCWLDLDYSWGFWCLGDYGRVCFSKSI